MKKLILAAALVCGAAFAANAQLDTLKLSKAYTTHVIFPTDLTYADLSNPAFVAAKIIEQNKNMLALKARDVFEESTSVSALESNGTMHTFIVIYQEHPSQLVIDLRQEKAQQPVVQQFQSQTAQMIQSAKQQKDSPAPAPSLDMGNVSTWKTGSAPMLQDIISEPQHLYHIGEKEYDIQVLCEDLSAYSDITYMIISLKNNSGISYDISDATFVIESKTPKKRSVVYDKPIFPRSRYGKLSAGPGEYTRIAYSFDKMTLSKDQCLRVYFYETGGQRNLVMTIDTKDINKARASL